MGDLDQIWGDQKSPKLPLDLTACINKTIHFLLIHVHVHIDLHS